MSFDYLLHKNNKQKRITKSELEMLDDPNLVIDSIECDETGDVSFFAVEVKNSPFATKYEFSLQETGEYWTSTYDYDDEDFAEFTNTLEKLGKGLHLLIDNPQTGEENLEPVNIFSDQMKKYLEIQRKVVGNIPKILKEANIEVENVKSDLELYEENRNKLIEMYDSKGYYVDNIMWGQKEGKTKYFCSWIVTVPTILPPVSQVIVLLTASEESPAYLIDIEKIQLALGNNMQTILDPTLHYLVEPLENLENQEALFKLGTKLK
jgi:hypothetical protein